MFGATATGWAAEREGDGEINTVACLENTETSAIGRALANLGLTASINRSSREEMDKADRARTRFRVVGERPRRERDTHLQQRAEHATETIALLGRAIGPGFSTRRAAILRDHLTRRDADWSTLDRIDRRLRDWMERRLDRVLWPS